METEEQNRDVPSHVPLVFGGEPGFIEQIDKNFSSFVDHYLESHELPEGEKEVWMSP